MIFKPIFFRKKGESELSPLFQNTYNFGKRANLNFRPLFKISEFWKKGETKFRPFSKI